MPDFAFTPRMEAQENYPYAHLRVMDVLDKQKKEYQLKLLEVEQVQDLGQRMLALNGAYKWHLTAMDRKKGIAELMPLEMFIDNYDDDIEMLKGKIKSATSKRPVKAKSYFYKTNGEIDKVTCDVLEYDERLKKFIVEFPCRHDEKHMTRRPAGRLNIIFEGIDTEAELERRYANALSRRRVAKSFMAEERIAVRDLALLYRDIGMEKAMRSRILDLVLQRSSVDGHRGHEIFQSCVMQVEALFVYETLRSVILSQRNDPKIIQLCKKHHMCHKPLVDHDGSIFPKYKQPPASAERRKDMLCAIESLRHTGFSSKNSIDLVGDILKVNQVLAE
jgi:hypothetical protein